MRTWPFPPEENSQIASPDAPSTTAMMTTFQWVNLHSFLGGWVRPMTSQLLRRGVVKNPFENLLKAMEAIVLPP